MRLQALSAMTMPSHCVNDLISHHVWCATDQCHVLGDSMERLRVNSRSVTYRDDFTSFKCSFRTEIMLLVAAPLEYPLSVSSHLCRGLPLFLASFILPSIMSSSIPPVLTTCPPSLNATFVTLDSSECRPYIQLICLLNVLMAGHCLHYISPCHQSCCSCKC